MQVGHLFDELLVALGAPRATNFTNTGGGKIPGNLPGHSTGLGSMLTILAKAIGSGLVGAVETLAQVFAGLGKYAKIGVDLASGNLGAAISAFLGKPNAGGAKGEFATVLTDIPKTLVTDVVKHIASAVAGFASAQQAASAGGAPGVPGGVAAGSDLQNLITIARYLMTQGASRAGAAGIAGTIAGESGGNPESVGCLTLDHMILTQRGWLKHDEVQPGDYTIGYNPETGQSEWTAVKRVVHYTQQPVVRISKRGFSVTATPNHRWLMQPHTSKSLWLTESHHRGAPRRRYGFYGTPEMREGNTFNLSKDRIVLAVPADLGDTLPITLEEAALLGWVAGDGSSDDRMRIYQSKAENFTKIEKALGDGRYTTYRRPADRPGYLGSHETVVYELGRPYARDLARRLDGLDPKADADKLVLRMSPGQRTAWLKAMHAAEGNHAHKPVRRTHAPLMQYYQNPDANPVIANAIELAVYLDGKRPGIYERTRPNGSTERVITETSPYLGGQGNGAKVEDAGVADVWCVTTELGTWTAKGG